MSARDFKKHMKNGRPAHPENLTDTRRRTSLCKHSQARPCQNPNGNPTCIHTAARVWQLYAFFFGGGAMKNVVTRRQLIVRRF